MTITWRAGITGDRIDLDYLCEQLSEGGLRVVRDGDEHGIEMDQFAGLEPSDMFELAKTALPTLNGSLRLQRPDATDVVLTHMRGYEGGKKHALIVVDVAHTRARACAGRRSNAPRGASARNEQRRPRTILLTRGDAGRSFRRRGALPRAPLHHGDRSISLEARFSNRFGAGLISIQAEIFPEVVLAHVGFAQGFAINAAIATVAALVDALPWPARRDTILRPRYMAL